MTAVQRVTGAWQRFWLTPGYAVNLAVMRIVVAVHGLWVVTSRDFPGASAYPEFWTAVKDSTRIRYLLFEGRPGLESVLETVLIAALIAVAVGVFPRTSAAVAGLILYHLAPLESIFWSPTPFARGTTLTVLALLLLAASPCADALTATRRQPATDPSWEYGWPVRLMMLFVCQIYLFSAWGKLAVTGLDWGSAENLVNWLYVFGFDEERWLIRSAADWLAAHPLVAALMGHGTFVFEAAFILAFFFRRLRPFFVVSAILFHIGILLLTGIHVGEAWLVVLLIDWRAVWVRFKPDAHPAQPVPAA